MKSKFSRQIMLGVTVCLLALHASAQVTQLTLQVLNQTDKKATYRLTNNSDKHLTCYSVAVDVIQNNGEINSGQESECSYERGILALHAFLERTTNIEGNRVNHSGIARVEIEPSLAVFQDGSSQARDDRSWHILMDNVKLENYGVRDVIDAIQSSGNDPVKAASILKAKQSTIPSKSPYDYRLKEALTFLEKSPKPDKVKAYVDYLKRTYASYKPLADLQPGGGK
ncbi:MAG TPA: hypothetical protein VMQ17_17945 [Candidatus Sulfotelmatobacter sp.]|nr:hypothetical protein [Candidatus Sulfotelmatobacter sp.]